MGLPTHPEWPSALVQSAGVTELAPWQLSGICVGLGYMNSNPSSCLERMCRWSRAFRTRPASTKVDDLWTVCGLASGHSPVSFDSENAGNNIVLAKIMSLLTILHHQGVGPID